MSLGLLQLKLHSCSLYCTKSLNKNNIIEKYKNIEKKRNYKICINRERLKYIFVLYICFTNQLFYKHVSFLK